MVLSPGRRPLRRLTDQELESMEKSVNENVMYSANDIESELARRDAHRSESKTFVWAVTAVAVSVVSLVVSFLMRMLNSP